jgi:predicted transcriptional regulator
MNTSRGTRMDRAKRKCLNKWIVTIESREDRHKQIIQSTVAKRALM